MMPVMKKVQRTSLCRRLSKIEGKGATLAPASRVRAIQGRSGSPWVISPAANAVGEASGCDAAGLGVLVGVTVGKGVAVKVEYDVGLGVLVKVAVGRGVGVAVAGTNWEITGHWLMEEELHAGVSRSTDSRKSASALPILKLESPLNGIHDVAVRQVAI
jgi:hypothetical protein